MPSQPPPDLALTFEIGPSFAPEDAARLHEAIERAEPGTRVEIDFHRVRDCHDTALAVLARDIAGGRARVALRGLSHHQFRLLGYLGASTGDWRRRAPVDAGDVHRTR
jgi:hypothetical protein